MTTEIDPKIESEINNRVEFKVRELLTGVRNRAAIAWKIAFDGLDQKQSYRWETFNELEQMIEKEIAMAVPWEGFEKFERKRRERLDEAVNKIMYWFRGVEGSQHRVREVVRIIEKAQDFL